MERPQSYLKGIEEVKILEKADDWVVREVRRQGVVVRQRLSADNGERELRSELLDHPAYTGWTAIRVIPASVQNPMAPLELECAVRLERKSFHLEGMLKSEEQLLAELKEAMSMLKEKAEEQEKRS
jgi:hypothetical protein